MSSEKNIPTTAIYLNAGISSRVIDFVLGLNNPHIGIYYYQPTNWQEEQFSPLSFYIQIDDMSQYDIDIFRNKLNNIYPTELDYDFTPIPNSKKVSKK